MEGLTPEQVHHFIEQIVRYQRGQIVNAFQTGDWLSVNSTGSVPVSINLDSGEIRRLEPAPSLRGIWKD